MPHNVRHPMLRVAVLALAVQAAGSMHAQAVNRMAIGSLDRVKVEAFAQLLSDATGRPFAVAGDIDAFFTVIVPGGTTLELPADDVYAFGLSVLASAGLSVVDEGNSCRIVRLPEGGGLSVGATVGEGQAGGNGLVTRVFRLEHAAADDVRRVLEGGGGRKGWIAVLDSSNHLVVTDTARTLERVAQLIAELDQPGLARVTEVVALQHAEAEALARQLNAAILQSAPQEGQQLATRLQGGAVAGSPARTGLAVASPHADSLILVGTAAQVKEFRELIARLDVDRPTGRGHLNAIPLQYLKAEDAAKSLSALLEKSAAKAADGRQIRRIAIESSVVNNALLVDAAPQDFEVVRSLLEQLDRAPEQVQISVLIAEIADSSGFTWGVGLTALTAPGKKGETAFSAGSRLAADTGGSLVQNATAGILPQGISAAISHASGVAADGSLIVDYPGIISIEALKADSDVEILSETALQAQNNVEATLSIVDEIPILKSTIEGGSGTARDVIQNIERQEVGVKLKLVPHVIPGGLVRMELNPSIESVINSGSRTTEFTPTIAKRTASTTVTVPDGQTIVIAGLTRKDVQKVANRIPLLGDIPLLGWLFRYTSEVEKTANLLILVTPTIIATPADAAPSTQAWRLKTGIHADASVPPSAPAP